MSGGALHNLGKWMLRQQQEVWAKESVVALCGFVTVACCGIVWVLLPMKQALGGRIYKENVVQKCTLILTQLSLVLAYFSATESFAVAQVKQGNGEVVKYILED